MKTLLASVAALGLTWFATPAAAYVVEVTTTVAIVDATDQAELRQAVQTAVDAVLKEAIAFQPTLVVLTRAMVRGDRLYIGLLIADKDGEKAVEELGGKDPDGAEPEKRGELKI